MRRVQRGHDRSFQPYSPMGWRVALRSGRVHKLCQRLRSSGSRSAAQVAHPAASTSAHDPPRPRPCVWPCELVWRRAWSSKANKRKAHEAPWRRVVCTGIDNPGSNVFPASRPVWQWGGSSTCVAVGGGTRYNFYLAARLMRRTRLRPLARTGDGEWRVNIYLTARLMRRIVMATHLFTSRAGTSICAVNSPWKVVSP